MMYHDQHCKKHNQWYADFLSACPICIGENMKPAYIDPEKKMTPKRPKLVKRQKPKKKPATPSLFD